MLAYKHHIYIAPNFEAVTTDGVIKFHDWLGGSWAILFSHPADFTPVCTTELGRVAALAKAGAWAQRNVKVIALSCNAVETHQQWIEDIKSSQKVEGDWPYPIISDPERELAVLFGMIDPDEKDAKGLPLTARAVFVFGPDKKLKLSLLYPATTGMCDPSFVVTNRTRNTQAATLTRFFASSTRSSSPSSTRSPPPPTGRMAPRS